MNMMHPIGSRKNPFPEDAILRARQHNAPEKESASFLVMR
jgi:hypothetical protein